MLQMIMEADGKEQILDLSEVPEYVLMMSCDGILRNQDLRNPEAQYILQETINALKVKAEEKPSEGIISYHRGDLKKYIAYVDDLLTSIKQE